MASVMNKVIRYPLQSIFSIDETILLITAKGNYLQEIDTKLCCIKTRFLLFYKESYAF